MWGDTKRCTLHKGALTTKKFKKPLIYVVAAETFTYCVFYQICCCVYLLLVSQSPQDGSDFKVILQDKGTDSSETDPGTVKDPDQG